MENRHHNADTQDRHTSTAQQLPANIDHAGLVAVARAIRPPEVYLPGPAQTASVTRLQQSVCIQSRQDKGDRYYSQSYASATAAASGRRTRFESYAYRER